MSRGRKPGRRWAPPVDRKRGQITDAEARQVQKATAHDQCTCGHYRVEHRGVEGCQRCRSCTDYTWALAPVGRHVLPGYGRQPRPAEVQA